MMAQWELTKSHELIKDNSHLSKVISFLTMIQKGNRTLLLHSFVINPFLADKDIYMQHHTAHILLMM